MKTEDIKSMIIRLIAMSLAAAIVIGAAGMTAGQARAEARTSLYAEESIDSLPRLPWTCYALYINDMSKKTIKPQCGPGKNYQVFKSMNGKTSLYNPREITFADAYFRVGNWVYVGFGYSDNKIRYGFFRKSVFTPYGSWSDIPDYSLDYGMYGSVTKDTVPYNGPGRDSGDYVSCKLYRGDAVFAVMESNGWYLCRFYNDHSNHYGYVFLWVPGSSISWY